MENDLRVPANEEHSVLKTTTEVPLILGIEADPPPAADHSQIAQTGNGIDPISADHETPEDVRLVDSDQDKSTSTGVRKVDIVRLVARAVDEEIQVTDAEARQAIEQHGSVFNALIALRCSQRHVDDLVEEVRERVDKATADLGTILDDLPEDRNNDETPYLVSALRDLDTAIARVHAAKEGSPRHELDGSERPWRTIAKAENRTVD